MVHLNFQLCSILPHRHLLRGLLQPLRFLPELPGPWVGPLESPVLGGGVSSALARPPDDQPGQSQPSLDVSAELLAARGAGEALLDVVGADGRDHHWRARRTTEHISAPARGEDWDKTKLISFYGIPIIPLFSYS